MSYDFHIPNFPCFPYSMFCLIVILYNCSSSSSSRSSSSSSSRSRSRSRSRSSSSSSGVFVSVVVIVSIIIVLLKCNYYWRPFYRRPGNLESPDVLRIHCNMYIYIYIYRERERHSLIHIGLLERSSIPGIIRRTIRL